MVDTLPVTVYNNPCSRVNYLRCTPILHGGVPERPKGADCKSVVDDFDGSNPSPSTKKSEILFSLFCCSSLWRETEETKSNTLDGYEIFILFHFHTNA